MEHKSSREARLWERIVDLVQEVDWLWNDLADVEDGVQRYYKNNVSKNAVRLNPSSRLMRVPRNTAAAAQLVTPSQHYFPFSSSFSASPIVAVVGDGLKGNTAADGAASMDEYQRNDRRVPQRRTLHLTESRLQKKLLDSYVIPASTDMKHALSCVKLLRDECITALESVTMTAHLLDEPIAFTRRHGEQYRFDQRYQEKVYEWKINARSRRIIATGDGRRASRDVKPLHMRPGYSGGAGRLRGGITEEKHIRVIREACRGVPPARIVELLLDPSQKTSLWKLREKCTAAMYMYHDFLQSSIADTNPTVVTESPGVRVFGDYTETYTDIRTHSPTFPRTSLYDSIARVAGTKSLSGALAQAGTGAGASAGTAAGNAPGVSATAKKTSGSPSAAQRYGGVGGDENPEFVTRKAFRDTVGVSMSLASSLSGSSSAVHRTVATSVSSTQKSEDGQVLKSTAVTDVAPSIAFVSPKKEVAGSVPSKSATPSGMVAAAGYSFTPQPRTEAKSPDSSVSNSQSSNPPTASTAPASTPGSLASSVNAKQSPPPAKSSPFAAFSFTTFGVGVASAGVSLPAPSSILNVSSPASALAAVGVPSAPALAMRKKISTNGVFSIPAASAAFVATSMPPPTPKAADVAAVRPQDNKGSQAGCAAPPPSLAQAYPSNTQDASACSTPTVATPLSAGIRSPVLPPAPATNAALPISKSLYPSQPAAVYSAGATFSPTATSRVVSPTNRVTTTYTSTNMVVAVASPPSSPVLSCISVRSGDVVPTVATSPASDKISLPTSAPAVTVDPLTVARADVVGVAQPTQQALRTGDPSGSDLPLPSAINADEIIQTSANREPAPPKAEPSPPKPEPLPPKAEPAPPKAEPACSSCSEKGTETPHTLEPSSTKSNVDRKNASEEENPREVVHAKSAEMSCKAATGTASTTSTLPTPSLVPSSILPAPSKTTPPGDIGKESGRATVSSDDTSRCSTAEQTDASASNEGGIKENRNSSGTNPQEKSQQSPPRASSEKFMQLLFVPDPNCTEKKKE